jgi:hypothetical protein
MTGTPWEGILAVEGIETGDGREFSPNSITWAEPPLALRHNIEESHGGAVTTKAVLVGRIDQVWRNPDNPLQIYGCGVFDDEGTHGAEALRQVKGGFLKGVSVDPDDIKEADIEFVFANEPEAFHMPGKHNQASHGGGTGGALLRARKKWKKANPGKRYAEASPEDAKKMGFEASALGDIDDDLDFDDVEFADDVDAKEPDDGGLADLFKTPQKTVFHAGRLRGATLCSIPAFVEAQIWLTEVGAPSALQTSMHFTGISDRQWSGPAEERKLRVNLTDRSLRQAFAHVTADESSTATGRFMHHHVDDEGNVGPGNMTAVLSSLRNINAGRASGLTETARREAYAHLSEHLRVVGMIPPEYTGGEPITASLSVDERPPREWFDNPKFDRLTAITVTDDGRVFGHGADWSSCHTGFADVCRQPPREGEHAYFRLGETVCADGSRVAVGNITLGTGHAKTRGVSAHSAVEHYDNTGTVVALVASGEDEFGIWVAGSVRPGTPDARINELREAKLSGDWRRIGGQLRLVAFLGVNTPGFPIPRLTTHLRNSQQLSMVAAGIVHAEHASASADLGVRLAIERIARGIGRDRSARLSALRHRVKG